ncbi:MAG: MATE family efflux transporter [Deltaproteobacteria bacterium]|nr:MATE family efflux transporter [Deltaproteobacteria bacterium]
MTGPPDPTERAQRVVEERLEELGDPEGAPANPAGTLAVGSGSLVPEEPAPGEAAPGTTREIWRLAWPVMLSQGLAAMVALIDVAMVGRLGPEAQAAVGYAVQLFFVSQSALFALSFACVAVMARSIGAGRLDESRKAFAASLVLALGAALVLSGLMLLAPRTLLRWLSASPEVIDLCIPYLQYLMASAVLMGVCLTIESGLRANKDTRTPLRITVVVTIVKIALNALLIFGLAGFPKMGVTGAGLATLIAQCVAIVLFAGAIARSPANGPTGLRRRDLHGMGRLFPELIRISIPGVGERLIMNAAMISYFAFIGAYGTVAAAAYTIGIRILAFSWIPGIGYSQAVATLVGQALGAKDPAAARRATARAATLAVATAIVMGAIGALARKPLAEIFTVDPETVATLGPFMLCLALAQPVMQLHFTLAGAFRGAGDTWTPLVAAVLGNWVFRVPLAYLAAGVFDAPLIWIWLVLIFDHLTRALWLTWSYRRKQEIWAEAP